MATYIFNLYLDKISDFVCIVVVVSKIMAFSDKIIGIKINTLWCYLVVQITFVQQALFQLSFVLVDQFDIKEKKSKIMMTLSANYTVRFG